jgi:hypothetical protein
MRGANMQIQKTEYINMTGLLSGIGFYILCLNALTFLKGDESLFLKFNMFTIIFMILINAWLLFQVILNKETKLVIFKNGFIKNHVAATIGAINYFIIMLFVIQMIQILVPDFIKISSIPVSVSFLRYVIEIVLVLLALLMLIINLSKDNQQKTNGARPQSKI